MGNKVIISKVPDDIKHYGVLGMKWGVRKDYSKTKKLYRVTTNPDESNVSTGYYTTSNKEARSFVDFVAQNEDIQGAKIYNMHVKLKDVILTPSEEEEINIQLELLKNKRIQELWSESMANHHMSRMDMWSKHQNLEDLQDMAKYVPKDPNSPQYKKFKKELKEAQRAYDDDKKAYKEAKIKSIGTGNDSEQLLDFSIAVFGSPELREAYAEIIKDKGYNAVQDYWGKVEQRTPGSAKYTSPSAIMILDKNIFKNVKVKQIKT